MRQAKYKWAESMSLADLFWCAEASANIAIELDVELIQQSKWSMDRMDEWDMRFKGISNEI